jgi:hypothetical protein
MLGDLLMRQGPLIRGLKDQQASQGPNGAASRDFITKYLSCLGLSPSDLDKLPRVLRDGGINADATRCIAEVMRSSTWDELFVKINLEAALLEAVARHEVQQLGSDKQSVDLLSLWSLYNFMTSINAIRSLMGNDNTRPVGLITLAKETYLLFDLLMELSKRKIIPPNLEIEIWKVRETLVDVMRELFKGNRTMTVDGKSFDGNKQLRWSNTSLTGPVN